MLPRRAAEVLCFQRRETPGKNRVKAIPCRESHSKAYPCQESAFVVPPQTRSVGWVHERWSRVQDDALGPIRHSAALCRLNWPNCLIFEPLRLEAEVQTVLPVSSS